VQIADIKRREISTLLDQIEHGTFRAADGRLLGGPVMADRVLAALRKLMNWYAARDDDFINPIVKGMARTKPKERSRDRVLSDDEIRALWRSLDSECRENSESCSAISVWGGLVRLLLLSAQRREEVAQMRHSEVDRGGIWTIPAARYKTGKPNVVPLSDAALAIIAAQERIGDGDLVFTTNGEVAFSGFSKAKKRLDQTMLKYLQASVSRGENAATLPEWRLHDLRRTAKTLMVRAGVRPDITERVLGHAISGVEGVYDRHTYTVEKRDALQKLEALIQAIVHSSSNVVPFADWRSTEAKAPRAIGVVSNPTPDQGSCNG
jgi:integrase